MRRGATLLAYAGAPATVVALGFIHAAYIGGYPFSGTSRFFWLMGYAALVGATAYAAGLPDVPRSLGGAVLTATGAAAAAAVAVSILQLASGSLLLPRYVVFWGALAAVPIHTVAVSIARGGWKRGEDRDRILLVGGPEEAENLGRDIALAPERPCVLACVASADEELPKAFRESGANVVVIDRLAAANTAIVDQVALLHERGARVRTLSLFYEEWLGKLPVSELERVSMMFDIGELHRARYARVRRLGDVALAVVGLVPLVCAVPLVWLGNLVANRGPLFHRQARVGRGGSQFAIYKFRTMRPGGDDGSWSQPGDPRVTRFGRLLRRTHLDELPQVVNVLRGHLSLVGPRPEQPRYVDELREKIPFYDLRHLIRPGITGWAQVKYGYAGDEQGALEKLQYDFFYLRHQGVLLDARILGRTLRAWR